MSTPGSISREGILEFDSPDTQPDAGSIENAGNARPTECRRAAKRDSIARHDLRPALVFRVCCKGLGSGSGNQEVSRLFDVASQVTACSQKINVFPGDLEASAIELRGEQVAGYRSKETVASGWSLKNGLKLTVFFAAHILIPQGDRGSWGVAFWRDAP